MSTSKKTQIIGKGVLHAIFFSGIMAVLAYFAFRKVPFGEYAVFVAILYAIVIGLRPETDKNDGIQQNFYGVMKLFGSRLKKEVSEGLYWWYPRPFGSIDRRDVKVKTLQLCFGGKESSNSKRISLSDGSYLAQFDLTIVYRELIGSLYETSGLDDIERYLGELADNDIRNAALGITDSIPSETLKKDYRNIRAVVLLSAITKWQHLIYYGMDYPAAKGIEMTNRMEPEVRDQYIEVRTNDNGKEVTIYHVLPKDARKLLVTRGVQIPSDGLREEAEQKGIDILQVTMSSPTLSDEVQAAIDSEIVELIQRDQETTNAETHLKLRELLMTSNDGSIDTRYASNLAAAQQGTRNWNVQIVSGDGSPDLGDKVVAAMRGKDKKEERADD